MGSAEFEIFGPRHDQIYRCPDFLAASTYFPSAHRNASSLGRREVLLRRTIASSIKTIDFSVNACSDENERKYWNRSDHSII